MAKVEKRKSGRKRAAPKKRARKAAAGSRGLSPRECLVEDIDFEKETKAHNLKEKSLEVIRIYR